MQYGDKQVSNSDIDSAIIDSGTSLILMPAKEFDELIAYIKEITGIEETITNRGGLESFTCTKSDTYRHLPHIGFTIDGKLYKVPPASYIGFRSGTCTVKVMKNRHTRTFVTLGLNFFENYYSVFDIDNKRIGLQTAKTTRNGLELDESF